MFSKGSFVATTKAYMDAFGLEGIPNAFVVDKTGAIVWQGHPMDGLDGILDRVLDGTYDLAWHVISSDKVKSRDIDFGLKRAEAALE